MADSGAPSLKNDAERYVHTIGAIPRLQLRIDCWRICNNFFRALESVVQDMRRLQAALDCLVTPKETGALELNARFAGVLGLILKMGNILNQVVGRVMPGTRAVCCTSLGARVPCVWVWHCLRGPSFGLGLS